MKKSFFILIFIAWFSSPKSQLVVGKTLNTNYLLSTPSYNENEQITEAGDKYSLFQRGDTVNTGNIATLNGESFFLVEQKGKSFVLGLKNNLVQKWETLIKGKAEYIGVSGGKLIIIANGDKELLYKTGCDYFGYIINPADGKITGEKKLFHTNDNYRSQLLFFFNQKPGAFHIAIRVSQASLPVTISGIFNKEKYQLISEWLHFEFDSDCNMVTNHKFLLPDGTKFLSAIQKSATQFVVCTNDEDQKITFRVFESGSEKELKSYSETLDYRNKSKYTFKMLINHSDHNLLHTITFYENENKKYCYKLLNIDLASGKSASKTQEFNKEYSEHLSNNKSEDYFKNKNKIGKLNELELCNFFIHNENIYVISGFMPDDARYYDSPAPSLLKAGNIVVTAFSGFEFTEKFTIVLPRKYFHYQSYGKSILAFVNNQTLHLVADNSFKFTLKTEHFTIDIPTGKPTSFEKIERNNLPVFPILNGGYCFRNGNKINLIYVSTPPVLGATSSYLFSIQELTIQ
jgi:hypothetical protein